MSASEFPGPIPLAVIAWQSGKRANGGLESLFEIASRLRRARPLLITQHESAYTERWRANGREVVIWPLPEVLRHSITARLNRGLHLLAHNAPLGALLRERRIRVVHCNDGSAAAMALLGARAAGARVLLNLRDTALGNLGKWRTFAALSQQVVVLSEEMRTFALERLAPPWPAAFGRTPIAVIPSIVDPERFSPISDPERERLRSALGIPSESFAVGLVAAVMPKKRQLDLLRSLAHASTLLPPRVRFYFVGDFTPREDAYAESCRCAADALGNRVTFTGFRSDVSDWYRALDLGLLVSSHEGLARSMIESLASGTPVVAFDFCSAREVLERSEAGRVVSNGDYPAVFSTIRQLEQTPELRRALGAAGARFIAREFAPERAVERYENLYLSLAAR